MWIVVCIGRGFVNGRAGIEIGLYESELGLEVVFGDSSAGHIIDRIAKSSRGSRDEKRATAAAPAQRLGNLCHDLVAAPSKRTYVERIPRPGENHAPKPANFLNGERRRVTAGNGRNGAGTTDGNADQPADRLAKGLPVARKGERLIEGRGKRGAGRGGGSSAAIAIEPQAPFESPEPKIRFEFRLR